MNNFPKNGEILYGQSRANLIKGCVETMDKKQITKILSFLSLTDGHLSMHKGCINASFHLTLSIKNKDLIELAGNVLESAGIGYKIKDTDCGLYTRLDSRVHPLLTKLWERLYLDKRKHPDPHTFKLLDWEAMALMYMCDGNIQKSGEFWYPMLNLCRWNYAELTWVKHQIKEKLDVDCNVHKCGKYWRLGFSKASSEAFFNGVTPFMTESFAYKLPYGKPQYSGW